MTEYWYPGADKSHRYDDKFDGLHWEKPDKGILHSTEGWGLPPYDGGAKAPHMTLVPNFTTRKFTYVQHFPFNMSSRALRNLDGGVQTNMDKAIQFEIVGTCVKSTHNGRKADHLYMPELPAWALHDIGKLVEWCNHEYGMSMTAPVFKSYETLSPGTVSVRMNQTRWNGFTGWCGHQHVPENIHLDPGNIDAPSIMAYARTFQEDRNMPSTNEIRDAVIDATIENKSPDKNGTTTLGKAITDIEFTQDKDSTRLARVETKLDAILAKLNTEEK